MPRRVLALVVATFLASMPVPVRAASSWGSPQYGDPPGWCTNYSDMWVASVVTNDPTVPTNPEMQTFYGFHKNPGYDDWYGWFYGDFRGLPGDSSGWVKLLHENYPQHYHWNFADSGWSVHGHAKEYIAYYNWTFGGQCGLGSRGDRTPPPYMADQFGYPVVDIYVDSVPPFPPQPYVSSVTPSSVAFTWTAVADRGDGAGADYFVSGLDHYVSWLTLSNRAGQIQYAVSAAPRMLELDDLGSSETACLHVQAFDRLQNSTGDQVACASPLQPPAMPAWNAKPPTIAANPAAPGLVGLETWFWLAPGPAPMTLAETYRGIDYTLTATPQRVDWDFGDGSSESIAGAAAFGAAFPAPSTVVHVYQAHDRTGYRVSAAVRYAVSWSAAVGGRSFGPYPLGTVTVQAQPLSYPVEQAQPVLLLI